MEVVRKKRKKALSLCAQCCQIDFSKVLDLTPFDLQDNRRRGCFISEFRDSTTYSNRRDCILCQLFRRIYSPSQSQPPKALHFRAYSTFSRSNALSFNRIPKEYLRQDIPHLVISSSDAMTALQIQPEIFCLRNSEQSQHIHRPRTLCAEIDYISITESIKFCQSKHSYLCSKKDDVITPLKLIDCYTSQEENVVHALPHTPYVALSYVWGKNQQPADSRFIRSSKRHYIHPKTISDAQIVVRKLGYRYLWVDQLCIDQQNLDEKSIQINLMDHIYNGAELTIVAAAGEDSEFGLPGVSTTMRQIMPNAELSDYRLISIPPHPHSVIKSSRWFTRAWTYQEALLSRRLLFFTEFEVYFECHGMQVRECLQWDYENLHCKQGKVYAALNDSLFLRGISSADSFVRGELPGLNRFYDLVEQFTTRKMTNEEDSLRAFMGIAKHLEGCKAPVFQLQGLPILRSTNTSPLCKSLLASLLWAHKETFKSTIPPCRRPSLPSWSWAGWEGQASFMINRRYYAFQSQATIENLQSEEGSKFDTKILQHNLHRVMQFQPKAIRLKGLFLINDSISIIIRRKMPNCRLVSKLHPPERPSKYALPPPVQPSRVGWKPSEWRWYPGLKAVLYIHKGPLVLTEFWDFFLSSGFKLFLVGKLPRPPSIPSRRYPHLLPKVYFLVLELLGGDCYSRVGLLEVNEELEVLRKLVEFEEISIDLN